MPVNIYGTPAVVSAAVISAVIDTNGAANAVAEDAAIGTAVGITAYATHTGYTVTYSLTDSSGGKFAIGGVTGIVTTAGTLDYATPTHTITILATSTGGGTATLSCLINVLPAGESVTLDGESVTLDGEEVTLR